MEATTKSLRDAKQQELADATTHKDLTINHLREKLNKAIQEETGRVTLASNAYQEAKADWELARQAKEAAEFRLGQLVDMYRDEQRQLDDAVTKAALISK